MLDMQIENLCGFVRKVANKYPKVNEIEYSKK